MELQTTDFKQRIICVTGKMAAGKNFICSQMEAQGWLSIDADVLVHQAIKDASEKILLEFGEVAKAEGIELADSEGNIIRRNLGRLLFSHKELLEKQEAIVHPVVTKLAEEFIKENSGRNIIINATVLYKTPQLMQKCEEIYFVTAPFFTRLFRARRRDNMPFKQIIKRFKNQKNLLEEYKKTGIPIKLINNSKKN